MKRSNLSRIIIIVLICIFWRYLIGVSVEFSTRDQYIFPTIGMVFFMIILGELTRKFFRIIFPKKQKRLSKYIVEISTSGSSDKEDIEALNFGIFWAFSLVIYVAI